MFYIQWNHHCFRCFTTLTQLYQLHVQQKLLSINTFLVLVSKQRFTWWQFCLQKVLLMKFRRMEIPNECAKLDMRKFNVPNGKKLQKLSVNNSSNIISYGLLCYARPLPYCFSQVMVSKILYKPNWSLLTKILCQNGQLNFMQCNVRENKSHFLPSQTFSCTVSQETTAIFFVQTFSATSVKRCHTQFFSGKLLAAVQGNNVTLQLLPARRHCGQWTYKMFPLHHLTSLIKKTY